jgi:steroid delta-isomerase-like uncharacterized protein
MSTHFGKETEMSVEENKRIAQSFYDDVFNAGKLEKLDELLADDFVEHEVFPGLRPDREGVKQFFQLTRSAFPDVRVTAEFMVGEGDLVATHAKFEGTHQGEFAGIPATGKRISVELIDIVKFRDGRAIEHWGITDQLSMMQQLGVVPSP